MTSAYIHIPFCQHICYYCDFNKVFLEGQPVDEYLTLLDTEMKIMTEQYPSEAIETIYIGGGTPTALSAKQLHYLLESIQTHLPLAEHGEFTAEANPGDLSEEKLAVLKAGGVNRLSIGVQSFDDQLLKKIGRRHTAQDVHETIRLARKVGFENISMDLIYALPNQTSEGFAATLEEALSLTLPHYSLYSLILENKTQFRNWIKSGRITLPGEDAEGDMFELAIEKMEMAGLMQYEVSNFALAGFESQHNLVYWNNEHYYGFGAGASGYLGHLRYRNHGPIQHYLAPLRAGKLPVVEQESLSLHNQIEEEMFLGLRKKAGVSKRRFAEKFGRSIDSVYAPVVAHLMAKGLLLDDPEHVLLTEKGLLLGNDVFEAFLLD